MLIVHDRLVINLDHVTDFKKLNEDEIIFFMSFSTSQRVEGQSKITIQLESSPERDAAFETILDYYDGDIVRI